MTKQTEQVSGKPTPSDESIALTPCPFCDGGRVHPDQVRIERIGIEGREHDETLPDEDRWHWYVHCRCCAAEGPWGKSPTSAANWWNRRVQPDASPCMDAHCEFDCEGWRAAVEAFRESHGTRNAKELIEEFRAAEAEVDRLTNAQPDASKLRLIAERIANERGNFRKRAPWTGDNFLYEEVAHILSILTEELEGGQK
jgi:hypothetical protein